jgi:CBS domain-containing protein
MNEKIGDIMTKNPVLLKLPASKSDALKLMKKHNVTGIPIINDRMEFVGIITRRDIFEKPNEDQIAMLLRSDAPTVYEDDDIKKGIEIFKKTLRRHIVVLNKENKVVGIITPYDYLKILMRKKSNKPVENYIKSPCILIYYKTPVKIVYKIITLTKLNAFPIVDDDSNLIGVVTDKDLIDNARIEIKSTESTIGLGEDEDAWTWEGMRNILNIEYKEEKIVFPKVPVEKIMAKNPTSILLKTPIYKAAKIMVDNNFSQLPVKDANEEIVAMIYDIDLLDSLMEE